MTGMATPPSDDTKMLFKLLADRDWHNYLEVRDAIAKSVPPGRAKRKYSYDLQANRRNKGYHHNDPDTAPRKTLDEQIEIGSRACAQVTISSWKRAGAVLQRGMNDGREIKVREGFTSWGIPGFEPQGDDDRPFEGGGLPDSPPDDSEPSQPRRTMADVFAELDRTHPMRPEQPESVPAVGEVVERVDEEKLRHFVADGEGQWRPVEPPEPTPPVAHSVLPEGAILAAVEALEMCEACGLMVSNHQLHDQWHAAQEAPETPSDVALLNESQLRDLIRAELGRLLDQFQEGLQGYLDDQFAEVEEQIQTLRRPAGRWIKSDG